MKWIRHAALIAATTMAAAPAVAQAPAIQAKAPGFFAGLGIGPGSFRLSCPEICRGDRYWGWSGNLRGGVAVGKQWLLGLEGTMWRDTRRPDNQEAIRQRMLMIGPVAYLYPTPNRKLNLKLSLGMLSYKQSNPDDDDDREDDNFSSTAFGASLGVAYDLRVAERLYFAPFFTFVGSTGGNLTRGDGQVFTENPNFSLLQFGVSVVYR